MAHGQADPLETFSRHSKMTRSRAGSSMASTTSAVAPHEEMQPADDYKSLITRYSAEWPRVAAIFSSLARQREREASDHDQTTERRWRGLNR